MKNNLSILKFVLIVSWLAAGFACGSQNQNNENLTNNANVPANNKSAKTDKKDPKEVCSYLPEFPPGKYAEFTSTNYRCESEKKEEKLAGGKKQVWTYAAVGGSNYIKWVEFQLSSNGTEAENLKAEKRFVETVETLWQKAFNTALPDNIKAELLVSKGKRITSNKRFSEPVSVGVSHVDTTIDAGDKIYGLQINIDLCNLCK